MQGRLAMGRSRISGFVVCALAAVMLGACGEQAKLAPTAPCRTSIIDALPAAQGTVEPLITLDGSGVTFEWCDYPSFALLSDGTVLYDNSLPPGSGCQPMVAHLSPEETRALLQGVLDLGFECLESGSPCRPASGEVVTLVDGTPEIVTEVECVTGAASSNLTVKLPSGELRMILNYPDFHDTPEALEAIHEMLGHYRHPEAVPYTPEMGSCPMYWACP